MNTAYIKLVQALNKSSQNGKVLDVSELKPDGSGSRIIVVPKTTRGNKKWVPDVPVVSDNYATYALAMSILGEGYLPYAQQYQALHGADKIARSPKASVETAAVAPFPMTPNMPALIQTTAGIPLGAKSPRAPRTPKAPRSPAIIQLPGGTFGVIRPASPTRIPRPASPTRVPVSMNRDVLPIVRQYPRVPSPDRVTTTVPRITHVPHVNTGMVLRPASPKTQTMILPRPASPRGATIPMTRQPQGGDNRAGLRLSEMERDVPYDNIRRGVDTGMMLRPASPGTQTMILPRPASPGRETVPFIPTVRVPSPTGGRVTDFVNTQVFQ